MTILLLDGSMQIDIWYEENDRDYADNICISVKEICPDDERLFRGEETRLLITPKQALQLSKALRTAADNSLSDSEVEKSQD